MGKNDVISDSELELRRLRLDLVDQLALYEIEVKELYAYEDDVQDILQYPSDERDRQLNLLVAKIRCQHKKGAVQ